MSKDDLLITLRTKWESVEVDLADFLESPDAQGLVDKELWDELHKLVKTKPTDNGVLKEDSGEQVLGTWTVSLIWGYWRSVFQSWVPCLGK